MTTALKGSTNASNSNQTTQILTQAGTNGLYNIIQPQIQIDGQETIFLQNGHQAIQIPAGQLLSPNQAAAVVRQGTAATTAQTQQGQIQYIQGLGNVAVRQGNMVQTLQLPTSNLMQTIPVQAITTNQSGQQIIQTINLPIQALQSMGAANVQQQQQQIGTQLMPQLQQVCSFSCTIYRGQICVNQTLYHQMQMTPIQVSQASGQTTIKQEATDNTTTQMTASTTTQRVCHCFSVLQFIYHY